MMSKVFTTLVNKMMPQVFFSEETPVLCVFYCNFAADISRHLNKVHREPTITIAYQCHWHSVHLQTMPSDNAYFVSTCPRCGDPKKCAYAKSPVDNMLKENEPHWFVMRIRNSSLSRLKTLMDLMGNDDDIDETYAPMRFIKVSPTKMDFVPYLVNYIFVHSSLERLKRAKSSHEDYEPLRFVMHPSFDEKLAKRSEALYISEKRMDDFKRVTAEENEKVVFLDNMNYACKPSQEVQITEGPFAGVVGRIKRIRGNRGIVIPIGKEMAVAIMDVPRGYMRLLTEEETKNIER